MKPIPYGRQNITEEDIQAVVETLKSDYLTQGPKIKEFEDAFAEYIGCKYAVAVSNGTSALHISALAMHVKSGDKVITTPITFVASANCVRFCGGEVVFADIDPQTYLLDIKSVRRLLESAPKGTYKGIIPVDFAGRAVNLEEYRQLADEYDLWIIEDACHAPGGYFVDSKGEKQNCGNAKLAELAIFSFHPVKHIACGEGGMVTTNDFEVYKELNRLRSHGITKFDDAYLNTTEFAAGVKGETEYPGWYMEMQELGYNYRITDIQAALGVSQLERADEGLQKRKNIAQKYFDAFKDKSFIVGQSGVIDGHAYHLYVIEVKDRLNLYKHLREHKIFAQIHYIPAHLMPYYREFGYKEGDLQAAENYYKHCISIPMYPTLKNEEQDFVINTITDFYND
ncbi:MAG: UDP-4-amino-4,6-dideoxy-N-acetyl-beta-L-altrosamine transaminase [Paludibacter sp.]